MLRQRLTFGPILIAALLALLYLDSWLHRVDLSNLSGTFLAPLLADGAHLPPGLILFVMLLVLAALAARELARIFRAKGVAADAVVLWLASVVGGGLMYVIPDDVGARTAVAIYGTGLVAVLAVALLRYSWGRRTEGVTLACGAVMLTFVYIGTLPGFYLLLRRSESVWVVAGVILVVKACDIGAYFGGRAVGRHKLIPWLSPGKTWEGLLIGMALAGGVGAGLAAVSNAFDLAGQWTGAPGGAGGAMAFHAVHLPVALAAVVGVVLGGIGQLGDLIASLLKRDAGIKDAGGSLPGFGGVLDVLDSPLLVAPVAYWLIEALTALGS